MLYQEGKSQGVCSCWPLCTREITVYKNFALEAHSFINIFYQSGYKTVIPATPASCYVRGGPSVNIYFVPLTGKKPNFKHQENKVVVLGLPYLYNEWFSYPVSGGKTGNRTFCSRVCSRVILARGFRGSGHGPLALCCGPVAAQCSGCGSGGCSPPVDQEAKWER